MKTDANCIFCEIVAGQIPCFKLLEDDDTLAFIDIYPASDGHCAIGFGQSAADRAVLAKAQRAAIGTPLRFGGGATLVT